MIVWGQIFYVAFMALVLWGFLFLCLDAVYMLIGRCFFRKWPVNQTSNYIFLFLALLLLFILVFGGTVGIVPPF